MNWKKRHKLRKIASKRSHIRLRNQLRKKPQLYNEYVKFICKNPNPIKRIHALHLVHFTKSSKRYHKQMNELMNMLRNGIPFPKPKNASEEYRQFFAKLRYEREVKLDGYQTDE